MGTLIEAGKIIQNSLERAGFKTLAAGGFVRDYLLKQQGYDIVPHDIDFATQATPDKVKTVFGGLRVIETGLKHGTVTVVLNGFNFEVTTLRKDVRCYGRDADVCFTDSFEIDAQRRDFTINSMYMDLNTMQVTDYADGIRDLADKKVNFVGEAEDRIHEDYLRIMRLFRFMSRLGFTSNDTGFAIGLIPYLSFISPERKRDELLKTLATDNWLELLPDSLIQFLIPELVAARYCNQENPYHDKYVYDHCLNTANEIGKLTDNPLLIFAALIHDVAKPYCKTVGEDGVGHFYGHDMEGVRIAGYICDRLKFSARDTRFIQFIIAKHMAFQNPGMKEKGYRRFINKCQEFDRHYNLRENTAIESLFSLFIADTKAGHRELVPESLKRLESQIARCMNVSKVAPSKCVSPLTGNEVKKLLGINASPKIGEVLRFLKDAVIDGKLLPDDKWLAGQMILNRFGGVVSKSEAKRLAYEKVVSNEI